MSASLTQSDIIEGQNIGTQTKLFKKTLAFSAGATAADLDETSLGTAFSGFLSAVRVLFGSTSPDSLTVTINDVDGHTLVTETLTASGSLYIEGTPVFVNGLTITIEGNTVNAATADISIIYFN